MKAQEEKVISLTPQEERVHHAIIDMYEIDDDDEVTRSHICNYTGMLISEVSRAMDSLLAKGIIKMGEDGVILEADNNGYYPIGKGDQEEE